MRKTTLLLNGLLKQNPLLVTGVGFCIALAATFSATDGLSMGLAASSVLLLSATTVAMLRKDIPSSAQAPVSLIISATFTSIILLLMQAFFTGTFERLNMYLPLIAVSTLITSETNRFTYKNSTSRSLLHAFGTGIGFTIALIITGAIRELLGKGAIFGHPVFPEEYAAIALALAPGGFIVLAYLIAIIRKINMHIDPLDQNKP